MEHKAATLYIHLFQVLCLTPCCHLQFRQVVFSLLFILFPGGDHLRATLGMQSGSIRRTRLSRLFISSLMLTVTRGPCWPWRDLPHFLLIRMWSIWLVVRPSGDFQVSLWMSLRRKLVPPTMGAVFQANIKDAEAVHRHSPIIQLLPSHFTGDLDKVTFHTRCEHFMLPGGSLLWGPSRFSHTPNFNKRAWYDRHGKCGIF